MTSSRRRQIRIPNEPPYSLVTSGRETPFLWGDWPWVVHADNGGRSEVQMTVERTLRAPDRMRLTLGTNSAQAYDPHQTERVELEGRQLLDHYAIYRWTTRLRLHGASPIEYEGTPGNMWQGWMLLMQAHQFPDAGEYNGSPPLAVLLRSDDKLVVTTRSTVESTTLPTTPLNAVDRVVVPLQKTVWHAIDLTVKFDRGEGAGYLKFALDGSVHYDGVIPIGFNDVSGPYFKHGLYRNQSPGQTVVEFEACEITRLN